MKKEQSEPTDGTAPSLETPEVAPSKLASRPASPAAGRESLGRRKVADPSPEGLTSSTPTRSETQQTGAEERSTVSRVVGLDLGEKISFCELKDGEVIGRATVAGGITRMEKLLGANTPPARVVFEACREAWVVHDQLLDWGHEPLMVDTTRARQLGIGQHRRKNDRIDAETLARALESGRIPAAHVLSPHRRELREHLGVRRALVEARAQLITTIRGLARGQGERLPACRSDKFVEHLRATKLDEKVRLLVEPLVKILEQLTPQIELAERKLEQLCAKEPVVARLATAPGVGPIVSAAFVSVIDEAKRFHNAHQVESYLGLVPSENTSGKRRLGSITKQGNSYMRALLIQAAHSIFRLRADDPLKRWAKAVEERRGYKIAVVAVARRLVGILWAMWRGNSNYDPNKLGNASAAGLTLQAQEINHTATQMRLDVASTGNRRSKAAAKSQASREASMS